MKQNNIPKLFRDLIADPAKRFFERNPERRNDLLVLSFTVLIVSYVAMIFPNTPLSDQNQKADILSTEKNNTTLVEEFRDKEKLEEEKDIPVLEAKSSM